MKHTTPSVGRLEIRGLSKAFGGEPVLTGAELTIEPGTTLALLGPSGCGKTTLLRSIAGLETIDSGSISLGGVTLSCQGKHLPPERRRVGMVFQDWALFPHLDVAANVAYGLSRDERGTGRVDDALAMVGLAGLGGRMPHTLSGGQQQRVALARAIAPRPAAILLDEPFSNLDATLRAKVRADTHRLLHEIGMTTLFVTHDQEEAFVVGDEVAIMRDGVILQQAEPATIYSRPADPWVAKFVGDANLLDVSVLGGVANSPVGDLQVPDVADGIHRALVRPEQLSITEGDRGKVELVEFYGHDTVYRIALEGEDLLVRTMGHPRFRAGDLVDISYSGPPVLVFPERAPASALTA